MPCHNCYNIPKINRQRYAFSPRYAIPSLLCFSSQLCYSPPLCFFPPCYAFSFLLYLLPMLLPIYYNLFVLPTSKCGYFVMSYTEILQYIQNLYYKLTETLLKATVITKCLFG